MNIVSINNLYIEESLLIELKNKLFSYGHNFTYYLTGANDDEMLINRIEDADVLIIDNHRVSNEVLDRAKHLKYIIIAFTGFDHIDVTYCKEHNIAVSNASGYATKAVAELTVGLIISYFRNVINFDKSTRKNLDKMDILGDEVERKTLGIIGYGKIGKQVVRLLENFDVKFLIYSHHDIDSLPLNAEQVNLETILKESDVVSLHTPLNDSTRNLISENELSLMKKSAILINTARGPIVNRDALIKALKNKEIKGACLDVFEKEPPINDTELCSLDNVILLPHVGYFTKEAMKKRFDIVEQNLMSYLIESKFLSRIV